MEELPEDLMIRAAEVAREYGDRLDEGISLLQAEVRARSDYRRIVERLVRRAVRDLVYSARHQQNRMIKATRGDYSAAQTAPRVNGAHEAVNRAYQSVYEYKIAGRTLGSLYGRDLPDVITTEKAIAGGHLFNAALCEWLCRNVGANQTVREAVDEATLDREFDRIRRRVQAA